MNSDPYNIKNQLQNVMNRKKYLLNNIYSMQLQQESLNKEQQNLEKQIQNISKIQAQNETLFKDDLILPSKEKNADLSQQQFNQKSMINASQFQGNSSQFSKYSNYEQANSFNSLNTSNLNKDIMLLDKNNFNIVQLSNDDSNQYINNSQSQYNSQMDQSIYQQKKSAFNDLKYNPANKSMDILQERNKKFMETIKSFQLEQNSTSHTEKVLTHMAENWVPKNQYKTYHTLTNGQVIDHAHIKSIPKAKVSLSDEVTGKEKRITSYFRSLDILPTDDEQTKKKKQFYQLKYNYFIKTFKEIQPKYIQESGYCKYTDTIRKTFVFFTQVMPRNKINRDTGVKPDTLKSWSKKYGQIDEDILDITDYDQEI